MALYKYVKLLQFDGIFYENTFWHIDEHGNGYKVSHMIGPVDGNTFKIAASENLHFVTSVSFWKTT